MISRTHRCLVVFPCRKSWTLLVLLPDPLNIFFKRAIVTQCKLTCTSRETETVPHTQNQRYWQLYYCRPPEHFLKRAIVIIVTRSHYPWNWNCTTRPPRKWESKILAAGHYSLILLIHVWGERERFPVPLDWSRRSVSSRAETRRPSLILDWTGVRKSMTSQQCAGRNGPGAW